MSSTSRSCAICSQPIDPERVEALPDTTLCVQHAHAIAKYGGEFKLRHSQVNVGKAGSLKKNYADVSVSKVRNDEGLRRLIEEHRQASRS